MVAPPAGGLFQARDTIEGDCMLGTAPGTPEHSWLSYCTINLVQFVASCIGHVVGMRAPIILKLCQRLR